MTHIYSQASDSASTRVHASPYIRVFEVFLLLSSLPLLLPLFAGLALAIKLKTRGPVFVRRLCLGKGGRPFYLYEFNIRHLPSPPAASEREKPLARWLRWGHGIGLPRLINVLRGEMRLIGPAPVMPDAFSQFPNERRPLLQVRPGLISPAQLYFWDKRLLLSPDEWRVFYREQVLTRQVEIELAYLRQRTLRKDLSLLGHLTLTVLTGGRRLYGLLALRNRHYFMFDVLAMSFLPALAMAMLHNSQAWPVAAASGTLLYTAVSLFVKLALLFAGGLYRRYWAYAGVNDLTAVVAALALATLLLELLTVYTGDWLAAQGLLITPALPLVDGLLTMLFVSGLRFGMRGLYHWHRSHRRMLGGRRVLVVGAGEAGLITVRELQAKPQLGMEPVLFVDDDLAKVGTHIQGLPVLGTSDDIPRLVVLHQIQRIIIAIPSAPPRRLRDIRAMCDSTKVAVHNLPGMYELLAGHKTISRLPAFDIDQLLRRDPVVTDFTGVAALLKGKTVLVTGAGGSIGSELCRQIARFRPASIVLLGHGENSIFEIGLDLSLSFHGQVIHQAIVDVRDAERVMQVVQRHRPQIIFHAAAHKHVPFMETHPGEAINNNILGTRNVLRAAEASAVEHFVLISTDKAISPANVMGATKRVAERLTQAAAQRTGRPYLAVRFGNVLGSRGSVVRVFQQQIAAGGPVTITHPDMTRFFMSIPEAVQLVLQAAALGGQGAIYVLDMGKPVRIMDLATDLIRLSGLTEGRDIEIKFSGVRPGEKITEELFYEQEAIQRTWHQRIFSAADGPVDVPQLEAAIERLAQLANSADDAPVIQQLRVIVPEYQPRTEQPPVAAVPLAPRRKGVVEREPQAARVVGLGPS